MNANSSWESVRHHGMMSTKVGGLPYSSLSPIPTRFTDSAYIFIGGIHQDLTEGDVITIFSQYAFRIPNVRESHICLFFLSRYGEPLDINMPRDKATGKPRGFAFLMYEDQRSTVLAVDNLNGAKLLERT